MKKTITLIICLLLSTFAFSGCVNRTEKSKSESFLRLRNFRAGGYVKYRNCARK